MSLPRRERLKGGVSVAIPNVTSRRRLDALSYPGHAIVVIDGFCAACGREVFETGDYRWQSWRHER
jgi:hypothetical protein